MCLREDYVRAYTLRICLSITLSLSRSLALSEYVMMFMSLCVDCVGLLRSVRLWFINGDDGNRSRSIYRIACRVSYCLCLVRCLYPTFHFASLRHLQTNRRRSTSCFWYYMHNECLRTPRLSVSKFIKIIISSQVLVLVSYIVSTKPKRKHDDFLVALRKFSYFSLINLLTSHHHIVISAASILISRCATATMRRVHRHAQVSKEIHTQCCKSANRDTEWERERERRT